TRSAAMVRVYTLKPWGSGTAYGSPPVTRARAAARYTERSFPSGRCIQSTRFRTETAVRSASVAHAARMVLRSHSGDGAGELTRGGQCMLISTDRTLEVPRAVGSPRQLFGEGATSPAWDAGIDSKPQRHRTWVSRSSLSPNWSQNRCPSNCWRWN